MSIEKVIRSGCALSAVGLAAWLLTGRAAPVAAQATQAPPAAAKAAAAELPDARAIIDRHIAAIGGRDVVLARTSSHVKGHISMPANGFAGPLEMYSARPNRILMRMSLAGIGEMEEGFDGTIGWMISSVTGPMLMEGRQLDQKKADSDFFGELKDPSRYESITTVERTTFDGRACYKVRLVHTEGLEDFEFYDVATGLKAGGQMSRETPMGSIASIYTHGDYRTFGPLLHPATQKLSTMGIDQILTVESIDYDTVDPRVFEPPAAIKALIK